MMTPERTALAAVLRDWLTGAVDLDAVRSGTSGVPDLSEIASLGVVDLLTDGGSVADLAVVHAELGRAAAPYPVGVFALVAEILGRIAPASAGLTALVTAGTGRAPLRAERSKPGWVVHGRADFVPWSTGVDRLAVFAIDEGDNEVLALIDPAAPGVRILERELLDLSRPFASVSLTGVELADAELITGLHERARLDDQLTVLSMADALGAAERLLEMTISHIAHREQFGVAVGSFQAVKHHAADMRVDVASSRSALLAALSSVESPAITERAAAVSSAAAYVFAACSRVAGTALQLHGGMGFTWEHDLHIYLRRIKSNESLAVPAWHRDRLIALL